MRRIAPDVTSLIGNTPLLRLERIERRLGLSARLLAKLECMNPGGSVKDRVALAMIEDAEARGLLAPGATLVEPTSGNTGIGLAMVAAARGYQVVLTMPDTMSQERRKLLAAYGARIVLTPGEQGMRGAIEQAERLRDLIPGAFMPMQFENPANPEAHAKTTALEILRDTGESVGAFVAGVGTGGTITGVGRALKQACGARIIAVEPKDSPVLSGGSPGAHPLQGIGAGFIPKNLDLGALDEVITVAGEDAFEASRLLASCEGVLCGITSGAALWAAARVARRSEMDGLNIVVLLPDTGERYLSTSLFGDTDQA